MLLSTFRFIVVNVVVVVFAAAVVVVVIVVVELNLEAARGNESG